MVKRQFAHKPDRFILVDDRTVCRGEGLLIGCENARRMANILHGNWSSGTLAKSRGE